ncbi:MAG TPA: HAMP domain-containing sensor histidine kinase [Nocardioidaceae bacterium]|nr:HAMP domain-containing sensor histidine kinase [Nocardioidaceae bacterium]
MTGEALGPLGRRFLAAFAAVALLAVVLVTAAGLVGADRGLTSQSDSQRREVAERVAEAASAAYAEAGGWSGADLGTAASVAEGGGATLVVRAADGTVVWPDRRGGHREGGMGAPGMGMAVGYVSSDVTVAGSEVGEVLLGFGPATESGRPVAWTWILVAGVAALLLALLAAWWVSRQLARPLAELTRAARSFAVGEGDTVLRERGVGELGVLADAFEEAITAVRRAEAARARMAADVAHELRTPLAALQAGLEELRDGLAPADPAALARLHDQALRVSRIVGDLDTLFAAEGATRAVQREPVDLADLARTEVEARAAQLRVAELDVDLDLSADAPVWVRGDPERLHQVLGNLLENCVRHCRPGDRVRVGVSASPSPRLVVTDTGPGIAPTDLPLVFDRFWRGSRPSGLPGSGLGLAVVRSLVEAMGGSVEVESDGSSGTTFTVTLPAVVAATLAT